MRMLFDILVFLQYFCWCSANVSCVFFIYFIYTLVTCSIKLNLPLFVLCCVANRIFVVISLRNVACFLCFFLTGFTFTQLGFKTTLNEVSCYRSVYLFGFCELNFNYKFMHKNMQQFSLNHIGYNAYIKFNFFMPMRAKDFLAALVFTPSNNVREKKIANQHVLISKNKEQSTLVVITPFESALHSRDNELLMFYSVFVD